MCGRFASTLPPDAMRRVFKTTNPLANFDARYNLAPTQPAPVVRTNPDTGERSLDLLRFGLIPHWAKDPKIGASLINARAESITAKPAFRDAFRRRRCLVPASAFYEWKAGTSPKQPFAIRLKDAAPFAFAGLWEGWKAADGTWLKTFAIITGPANELVSAVHDRMPVILDPGDYAKWLGEQPASQGELLALLKPYPAGLMEIFPVGPAVSNVRNEGAALLERLDRR